MECEREGEGERGGVPERDRGRGVECRRRIGGEGWSAGEG